MGCWKAWHMPVLCMARNQTRQALGLYSFLHLNGRARTALCTALQVVCAGSQDSFQIFVWSLKTGRLLDALAAHEGPVVALAFAPNAPLLASASWDK